jgi:hypothetical protein
MRKKVRRLAVKKDRLRNLTSVETDQVRGGDPAYTHHCYQAPQHPNCPNDSRYCL